MKGTVGAIARREGNGGGNGGRKLGGGTGVVE